MNRAWQSALLAAALAIATWAGGWTALPLVAFLWGAWRRTDVRAPVVAAVASPLAWALLLGVAAIGAPVLTVAERVGGLAGVPSTAIVAVMLAFAAGLGWSAAEIGRALLLIALGRRPAAE